jgi:hypothetical protein
MSTRRTAWHYFLGLLLTEKAPRCFEIIAEAPVTLALQHMDWLILRRRPWSGPPDRGETLVALWPHLPRVTIGEYKSDSRQYRRGEVHRLLGYGHQYAAEHVDYIALFAHRSRVPDGAHSWWYARDGTPTEDGMDVRQLEEFKAMQQRYLSSLPIEDRLAGLDADAIAKALSPEQRLAGLDPEQRLAGLAEADAVLAMPDAVLAGLTDAFVDALPADIRTRVRARRAAHAAAR